MSTFSIYIHVPWCRRRCPYCNFYLEVGRPSSQFVDAIISEWNHRRVDFTGIATTLYFGGGTPSLLAPREIKRLTDHFRGNNLLAPDAEITLEANPEDLTQDFVDELSQSSVNRISLGIQSFDDSVLRTLGRRHTGAMAKEAIARLQKSGITNISVDQIIGVPGENLDEVASSLEYLRVVDVKHVSCYLLTIEEGTHFHRQKMSPSDDAQADAYGMVQHKLSRLGYEQYDISSYALPGFMSRHNQGYWSAQNYVGLGPGAHSMRKLNDGEGIERAHNQASLSTWLAAPIAATNWIVEKLAADEAIRESLAFGLRNMVRGVDARERAAFYGVAIPIGFVDVMTKFIELGFIRAENGVYAITPQGALFADAIMRDILSC